MLLDEILKKLDQLPPEKLLELERKRLETSPIWIPTVGPQADAFFSRADVLLYGGQGGGGKALALNTQLATPTGWTSMGEVRIGDVLFDENGTTCSVVGATPIMRGRPCFRVVFSDGAEIVADAEHEWLTLNADERHDQLTKSEEWRASRRAKRKSRAKAVSQKPWVSAFIGKLNSERKYTYLQPALPGLRTTEQIRATLSVGKRDGKNHSVAVARALQCDETLLLIDPYLLGLWLGDGTTAQAAITTADPEIVEAISATGYTVVKRNYKYAYGINGGLKVALRQLGVLGNKHIPAAYLRGSEQQRLSLLQGLMDTDGYCDKRGQCDFTSTKRRLIDDVRELIWSLGIKGQVREGVAKIDGRVIGPKYSIKFMTEKPAFRLARKLIRQKRGGFRGTHDRRYIVAVEPIESVPVRCIEVDSPSHLYLAGREMIPTHNSDLGLGLAFTAHERSLVMRRQYANLSGLTERAVKIHGGREGFNGSPPPLLRTDKRYIQFGANQRLGDEQAWQGIPFDFKYFDEATQFLELQVRFHLGWIRTTTIGQRCRAVLGSNPPMDADGDWIVGMFRPWLDLTHPKPAKHGELRWFVTDPDGKDLEVADGKPILLPGTDKPSMPLSRTFIPAALRDNPYLVNTNYQAQLDALPEPIRSAVRDGNFMAARQDAEWQVIPVQWIIDAQARWKPDGWKDFTMTAVGFDPAGGGKDSAELALRHGPWYAELISKQGEETADGSAAAATIFKHRRDIAAVIVDVGGGYGGAVKMRLKDNGIEAVSFNGAAASHARSADGSNLRFRNKRAEAWWRFREALNPDQEGGSPVALPPDTELRSELAAPTYEVGINGIQIESKEELRKRLGRSPGKADAVVMALSEGDAAIRKGKGGLHSSWYQNDRPKFATVSDAQRRRRG